jgi:hypothetical protein
VSAVLLDSYSGAAVLSCRVFLIRFSPGSFVPPSSSPAAHTPSPAPRAKRQLLIAPLTRGASPFLCQRLSSQSSTTLKCIPSKSPKPCSPGFIPPLSRPILPPDFGATRPKIYTLNTGSAESGLRSGEGTLIPVSNTSRSPSYDSGRIEVGDELMTIQGKNVYRQNAGALLCHVAHSTPKSTASSSMAAHVSGLVNAADAHPRASSPLSSPLTMAKSPDFPVYPATLMTPNSLQTINPESRPLANTLYPKPLCVQIRSHPQILLI